MTIVQASPHTADYQALVVSAQNSLLNQANDGVPYGINAPNDTELLLKQNLWHGYPNHRHHDGSGVAIFENGQLTHARSAMNANVSDVFQQTVSEHGAQADVAMYHLRAAETGKICDTNSHPFKYKGDGTVWAFTMNGDVDINAKRLAKAEKLLAKGNNSHEPITALQDPTDSERLLRILLGGMKREFGTINLDHLLAQGQPLNAVQANIAKNFRIALMDCKPRVEQLKTGSQGVSGTLLRSPNATITLSNGHHTFVINHESGQWFSTYKNPMTGAQSLTLASEPVYDGHRWQQLPNDVMVTVSKDPNHDKRLKMSLQSLSLPSGFELWHWHHMLGGHVKRMFSRLGLQSQGPFLPQMATN